MLPVQLATHRGALPASGVHGQSNQAWSPLKIKACCLCECAIVLLKTAYKDFSKGTVWNCAMHPLYVNPQTTRLRYRHNSISYLAATASSIPTIKQLASITNSNCWRQIVLNL